MGTAVRPAKTTPGPWDAFADVDGFVDQMHCQNLVPWKGRHPAAALGAQAATGRSGTAQGDDGDLVCLLLWHSVAGHRTALRYPLQHAVTSVFARWTRAGLWRQLLDRLRRTGRRVCGDTPETERSGNRQSLVPLGAELLCARHQWWQEDPRRQDPDGRREIRHPSGDRCRAGEPA
jgi:hypothetical protein